MQYIAYYRVSTKEQGSSGLGVEAQKASVKKFVNDDEVLMEFIEIESGANNNRETLKKAIDSCKKHDCTLVVAKLDRLSRDLTFISSLMDSKVKFICADMPVANEFTIHIFAALAQQERKMISERTTAALKALKARGIRLGTPKPHLLGGPVAIQNSRNKHIEKRTSNQNNIVASAMIRTLREKGLTFEKIADKLNAEGFKSAKNGIFHPMQCYRLFNYDKNK